MPESALRCPGCGAPAAADAIGCAYCGSPLATVTCPSCFAPIFVGSRFCSHCGAEATRELLDEDSLRPCPRCVEAMERLRLGPISLHSCTACGGLWLDPLSLQHLVETREERAGVLTAVTTRIPTRTAAPDVIRYVPCPVCTKLMNRVNFASSSGVVMDVCKQDGVWLDRGELQRVVGFVDGGGLTVARNRERERLAEEQRRLRAMTDAPKGGMSVQVQHHDFRRSFSDDSGPTTMLDTILRDAIKLFIT